MYSWCEIIFSTWFAFASSDRFDWEDFLLSEQVTYWRKDYWLVPGQQAGLRIGRCLLLRIVGTGKSVDRDRIEVSRKLWRKCQVFEPNTKRSKMQKVYNEGSRGNPACHRFPINFGQGEEMKTVKKRFCPRFCRVSENNANFRVGRANAEFLHALLNCFQKKHTGQARTGPTEELMNKEPGARRGTVNES